MSSKRYYGGDGTIHSTTYVDVEVNMRGKVVAVWFRCQPLPFIQSLVDLDRDDEMHDMYHRGNIPALNAVEVID